MRVYGLTGEALLNFGPWGVLPAYAIYGACLGWYRRKLTTWDAADARTFLAPLVTILFATAFIADSDNVLFLFVVDGSLITAAFFASTKIVRPVQHAPSSRVMRQTY
jgi:hypothetical protein